MSIPNLCFTIARHAVPMDADGLSPLQRLVEAHPAPVRVFSAPTGAGKSFAFIKAAAVGRRVLFVVPTRRLAQNLAQDAAETMARLDPPLHNAVALWSSDETARQRELDPSYRLWQARVRQVTDPDGERFVVATPETVALMLLRHASGGAGLDPFGPASLVQGFQHVVFDEFHSIDPRGFGLCAFVARLCAFAAAANPGNQDVPRATFLSATPVSIAPALVALGVPSGDIAVAAEKVVDDPSPGPIPGQRVLHGDVAIRFHGEPDMVALLDVHVDEVRACLASKRQLVVILDNLGELHTTRGRFAALFDRIGIPVARRLAINSIDDSASGAADGLFTANRAADPRDFDVLLATSSVEMGVTFRAGMLAMDPGHDALSFVQRVGRVARADEPGLVLVRQDPARDGKRPWLRELRLALDEENAGRLSVSRFNALVLGAVRKRFEAAPDTLDGDALPGEFRSMPQRAVWAACLFWHAWECSRPRFLAGERAGFDGMRPSKVGRIAHLLRAARGEDELGAINLGGHWSRQWAKRFLEEAKTLRDIAPTVSVRDSDGGCKRIPLHFLDRFPVLAGFPLSADEKGGWTLQLDRPLSAVMADAASVFAPRLRTVLLPDGQSMTRPASEVVEAALGAMRRAKEDPGTTAVQAARFDAAMELVRLTRLLPSEDEIPAVAGVV